MTTDLDAIELRAMRFQKLNPLHECFDSATVLALISELRQERERAGKAEALAAARWKTIGVYMRENAEWELRTHTAERALSRAEEAIDRINALLAPVLERVDREQVGTHGPECHTRHLGCLALAIERALTEYGKQKESDRD